MERSVYSHMADLDQRHWWYLGRRRILASLVERLARPPAGARILEVGCGTGHNLAMLQTFGEVDAVELDDARRLAVADARRKAELYAKETGVQLGEVLLIQEQPPQIPGPRFVAARAEASAVPIAEGELDFATTIELTFAIKSR